MGDTAVTEKDIAKRRLNLPAIALLLFGVPLVVALFILTLRGPRPPLSYTRDIYCAERSQQLASGCGPAVYAPGETLVYTASLEIQRAGALELVRGWRTNPGEGRPRLCNGENAPVIQDVPPPFSPGAIGNEVEGRIEAEVPDLPPGNYWLVSSVSKRDGGEALTRVPFSIVKTCDGR